MQLRLIEQLRLHARRRPTDIAIRQIIPNNGATVDWRGLADRVNAISGELSKTLPAGSIVMLVSANRPEYTAAFLAILASGMTVFPIAPDIAGPELFSAGQRSGGTALLAIGRPELPVNDAFRRRAPAPACSSDAMLHFNPAWETRGGRGPALLLLSSGTTGQPKIVRRDGASIDAVSSNMVSAIGFLPADRVLAAVPLCHSYGMEHGLLCPTWAGCCAHLYDRFDLPAAADELTRGAVTVFPGVPFMFETLAGGAATLERLALRRAYSAGGPLPRPLFDAFRKKFAIPIAQLYGATEIGSVAFNDPDIQPFDPASVGRAMEGVSIRILDPDDLRGARSLDAGAEGQVAVAAPSMLDEYIDGEQPLLADGHFLTGDMGRVDAGGALTITGRLKLLIDVAGRKVNPLEVEQVLEQHPAVAECVVVPVRVSETLNRLRAVVIPADPNSPPTAAELRQFARARLGTYKVPRIFDIRATLPRSAAGKILRHALEAEATDSDWPGKFKTHRGDAEAAEKTM